MLLSNLDFASFLAYSPRGKTQNAKRSRTVTYAVKQNLVVPKHNITISEFVAQDIKKRLADLPFKNYLGSNIFLVPTPKSSPMKEGSLWVPKMVVQALSKVGLGKEFDCLERVDAVPKSALSSPQNRPKASDHYRTIRVKPNLKIAEKRGEILLVDDVVTRGATLLGAASRLCVVFPDVPIKAFVIIRTISDQTKFNQILDLCVGVITLVNTDTFRDP